MESVVDVKLESKAPPVYAFESVYGADEILCEKKSAARSEIVVTAAAVVIAVLSVIPKYFLITIISGLAALSGIFSLSGIKRSAEKTFSEKGEETRLYAFYVDGFLVQGKNSAAYFPYEKLCGFRETKGHIIIKADGGTEYIIPKNEKTDSGFIHFLGEKINRIR
ncbi:MAG: YcxB family protein [Oscillospiraceae bacterium]